jgi:hypothetical protein
MDWLRRGRTIVATALFASVLMIGGCGGDDGSGAAPDAGSGTEAAVTKGEYIHQTDGICAAAVKQASSLLTGGVTNREGSKGAAFQRLIIDVQPVIADAELAALSAATSDAKAAASYAGKSFFPKFSAASAEYGMKGCASATGSVVSP